MLAWEPALVLTMTTGEELAHAGAGTIGADLAAAGVVWRHLPVPDFSAPPPETVRRWPEASGLAHEILSNGGKILAHCFGGCGRSGMAVMRLMVEAGEEPVRALARLRQVRPCAVESAAQQGWAAAAFRSGT